MGEQEQNERLRARYKALVTAARKGLRSHHKWCDWHQHPSECNCGTRARISALRNLGEL